eukprot:5688579-Pleurochrysis_carterae.AAC.4
MFSTNDPSNVSSWSASPRAATARQRRQGDCPVLYCVHGPLAAQQGRARRHSMKAQVVEVSASAIENEAAKASAAVRQNDENETIEDMDDEDGPGAGGKRQRGAGGSVVPPSFGPVSALEAFGGKSEFRRVPVPPNRYSPLRKDWMSIYTPIVEQLKVSSSALS